MTRRTQKQINTAALSALPALEYDTLTPVNALKFILSKMPDETQAWGDLELAVSKYAIPAIQTAEAPLFSAAPHLLDALKEAIHWVDQEDQGAPEMIAKWNALIASAEDLSNEEFEDEHPH